MPATLTKPAFDLGIVTTDIEESLRFYRDLLGFVPLMVLPLDDGDLHLLIAGEMLIKLKDSSSAARGPKGEIADATGLRYVTFWVSGMNDLLDELRAAGVNVMREPFEVLPNTMAALVTDPDGNVVEFLESPPVAG